MESKYKIINKLLETIENITTKAVQPKPLSMPQLHSEDDSNDTNESKRKEIKPPEIKNTSNKQKDSHREMNNLNLEKPNPIEKGLNDVKLKKEKNVIILKATFKVILL